MSDQYIGEIRVMAGPVVPKGWAICDGSLIKILENTELFSILSTTYGGDGVNTFGLPDLRGRVAIGQGQGAGPSRSKFAIGTRGGTENVTLTLGQIPAHTHPMIASNSTATSLSLSQQFFAVTPTGDNFYAPAAASNLQITLDPDAVQSSGGNQDHENRMPFMALNYIIAVEGIYPTQN